MGHAGSRDALGGGAAHGADRSRLLRRRADPRLRGGPASPPWCPSPCHLQQPGRGSLRAERDLVYDTRGASEYRCPAGERAISPLRTTVENGMTIRKYWSSACPKCVLKDKCTTSNYRRIARWGTEAVLDRDADGAWIGHPRPRGACGARRSSTSSARSRPGWGSTHFLTKTLARVRTEVSLQALAYNMKRVMTIVGIAPLLQAMRA